MTRKIFNERTVWLELKAAQRKLRKKYPKAGTVLVSINSHDDISYSSDNVSVSIHFKQDGQNTCIVESGELVSKIVLDIQHQAKEFAHLLQ